MLVSFRLISFAILFPLLLTNFEKVLGADDKGEVSSSQKQICLMESPTEYASAEWLTSFTAYTENKGRQKQRLEASDGFTKSHVRYVKDSEGLSVGYPVLKKARTTSPPSPSPSLVLPREKYESFSRLGFMVKVLNGYVQNFDFGKQTFTPETTNFLIPHVSYVIQWNEDEDPQLVPAGMMRTPDTNFVIVFMSGAGDEDTKVKIEAAYNSVIRREDEEKINIYSGSNIVDQYLPYILREAIERREIDIFKDPYLGTVANKLAIRFPYTKDTDDPILKRKNTICLTAQALEMLFKRADDKLFKERKDTVSILLGFDVKEESKPIIEEEDKDEGKKEFKEPSFKKAMRDNRNFFIKAALIRIYDAAQELEEKDKSFANDLISYLRYIVDPGLITQLDKAKEFWELVKKIGRNLTCANPDAQGAYSPTIPLTDRLRKYALSGYGGSHTERILVKLVRTNPLLITQPLDRLLSDKPASSEWKPKFLGIVIDTFSWLDICSYCASFLHTNLDWVKALEEMKPVIEGIGFSVPFPSVNSLFRVLSQQQYGNAPSDLVSAGGGVDYTASGWDFRVLSEERYTLATRRSLEETLLRDQTFEKIHSSVMKAAITKPLEFWWRNSFAKFLLTSDNRDLFQNVRDILYLRFQTIKPLAIKKAIQDIQQDNYESAYGILSPYVRSFFEFKEEDKEGSEILIPDILREPEYLKCYFGVVCLKRARSSFKSGSFSEGKGFIDEFSRFGIIHTEGALCRTDSESAESHVIRYWQTKWRSGKERSTRNFSSNKDKSNTQKFISLLWKLAHKIVFAEKIAEENQQEIKVVLGKSGLESPKWLKREATEEE